MPTSPEQFDAMKQRTEAGHGAILRRKGVVIDPMQCDVTASTLVEGVTKERELHDEIIRYCDSQWPRWKYIHARMDKRSTIAVGAPDFVIFTPGNAEMHPRVFAIECKRAGQKPTPEQLAWHKEIEMLGHKVHVIYSLAEFKEITR